MGTTKVPPFEGDNQIHHRWRGCSTTNAKHGTMHHPHKNPSLGHKVQERIDGCKENKEGCIRDGDR